MAEIFFGSREDEIKYFAKKGEVAPERPEEEKQEASSEMRILDLKTLEPITEKEERMLNRTRCLNDPMMVYMQSDIQFYDRFYNDEEIKENPLLKQVHSLRKVYRDYKAYRAACMLREEYLDWLKETYYGNDDELFETLMLINKNPAHWLPPKPIFNNVEKVPVAQLEAKLFDTAVLWESPSEEDLKRLDASLERTSLIRGEDIVGIYTVPLTDIGAVLTVKDYIDYRIEAEAEAENRRARRSKNINSEVKDIIKSWYESSDDSSEKREDENQKIFYYSKESIEDRYYDSLIEYQRNDKDDLRMYYATQDVYEDENDSELVYDEVTARPMNRSEYRKRSLIRKLGKCGWNELQLMDIMGVGTRQERSRLERRERKSEENMYKVTPETRALREQLEQQNSLDYFEHNQTLSITDELDKLLEGGGYF